MSEFLLDLGLNLGVTLCYNDALLGPHGSVMAVHPERGPVKLPFAATNPARRLRKHHRKLTAERIRRDYIELDRRLHKSLFHRKFYYLPPHRRLLSFAVMENLESNPHLHSGWRVPDTMKTDFIDMLDQTWRDIVPSGSTDVVEIRDAGWFTYCQKNLSARSYGENTILSSEFWAR
jgi:hypothetical protein